MRDSSLAVCPDVVAVIGTVPPMSPEAVKRPFELMVPTPAAPIDHWAGRSRCRRWSAVNWSVAPGAVTLSVGFGGLDGELTPCPRLLRRR